MSMPEFPKPNPDFTQEQALTMILSSIALEEAALSHIINAESEKIQYVLNQTQRGEYAANLQDILAVNKSVTNLLEMVLQNQMILKSKMEKVLEHLPQPPSPPAPPEPPRPPKPPCPPDPPCCVPTMCCIEYAFCLRAIPRLYCAGEALQWQDENVCGRFRLQQENCSNIQMPRTGTFAVDLYLDTDYSRSALEGMLVVCCEDQKSITKKLSFDDRSSGCSWHKRTFITMPCSCCPCYASVVLCVPDQIKIRRGTIVFTRL